MRVTNITKMSIHLWNRQKNLRLEITSGINEVSDADWQVFGNKILENPGLKTATVALNDAPVHVDSDDERVDLEAIAKAKKEAEEAEELKELERLEAEEAEKHKEAAEKALEELARSEAEKAEAEKKAENAEANVELTGMDKLEAVENNIADKQEEEKAEDAAEPVSDEKPADKPSDEQDKPSAKNKRK